MSLAKYKNILFDLLGTECQGDGPHKGSLCVHHRNGDATDNRLENLMLVCQACHNREHGKINEYLRQTRGLTQRDIELMKIIESGVNRITYILKEMTKNRPISGNTIRSILEDLEEWGYVERKPAMDNWSRWPIWTLTKKGVNTVS